MSPIRVLILEDDEDIVELLESILDRGFETVSAANGLEGLQMAEAAEPDLVICDIMMPVMDGWEFMRTLRTQAGFEHTPVIFLSALSSADQIRRGYELGAALYLTKPLNPTRLKRNIELFISDHGIEPRPKRRRLDQLHSSHDHPRFSDGPAPSPPLRQPRFTIERDGPRRPRQPIITPPPQNHAPIYTPPPEPEPTPPPEPETRSAYSYSPPSHLPRAGSPQPAPEPPPPKEPAGPIRLLVVEDDKDTCQMLRAGLAEQYEVVEAGDGITAIERAIRFKPDIFIVDGMLPRMTGYQLTVMLKKNREFYRAPIVFISGKASQRDRDYAHSLGITTFMAKPFTPDQMLQTLQAITAQADFNVRRDRPPLAPGPGEFTHYEAHRKTVETQSIAEIEDKALEQRLKQQLS